MKTFNISFDFDSTLSRIDVQEFIKFGLSNLPVKFNIHIVTSRFEDINRYTDKSINHINLFKIAQELNISIENIHFLNMDDKANFFINNNDFLFHLDDDAIELELIKQNENNNVIPIHVKTFDWKEKCLAAIYNKM
jgi:hypothetical protein